MSGRLTYEHQVISRRPLGCDSVFKRSIFKPYYEIELHQEIPRHFYPGAPSFIKRSQDTWPHEQYPGALGLINAIPRYLEASTLSRATWSHQRYPELLYVVPVVGLIRRLAEINTSTTPASAIATGSGTKNDKVPETDLPDIEMEEVEADDEQPDDQQPDDQQPDGEQPDGEQPDDDLYYAKIFAKTRKRKPGRKYQSNPDVMEFRIDTINKKLGSSEGLDGLDELVSGAKKSHGRGWLIGRHDSKCLKTSTSAPAPTDSYVQELTKKIRQEVAVEVEAKVNQKVCAEVDGKINRKVQDNLTLALKKLAEANPTLNVDIGEICATISSDTVGGHTRHTILGDSLDTPYWGPYVRGGWTLIDSRHLLSLCLENLPVDYKDRGSIAPSPRGGGTPVFCSQLRPSPRIVHAVADSLAMHYNDAYLCDPLRPDHSPLNCKEILVKRSKDVTLADLARDPLGTGRATRSRAGYRMRSREG
ncbi:hypothetical protein POM88_012643 [Heracleum sosnowskyi]|uniref:Uncharacterized protein n=1 Tax=Heracleum sosnowskyi TaxID=360622 RepID=A0AAD8N2N5_9APIA|nr:hypothetical protein POM88_012643 [Heracleum sosnowskyi]